MSPEEKLHHGRLTAAISRYLALNENTNLKLTTHGEDWICESYCHKTHCSAETVFTRHERDMGMQLAAWKKKQGIPGKSYVRNGFEDRSFFILTNVATYWAVLDSFASTNQVFA